MASLTLPIHTHRRGQSTQSRLVNCYAEATPAGSKAPITLRGCPGIANLGTLPTTPYRGSGVFQGVGYAVGGNTLYSFTSAGATTSIGTIAGDGRVSFAENRDALSIYTSSGDYTYDGTTLAVITDPEKEPSNGIVDVIEGYAVHTRKGTDQFAASRLADSDAFDALDFDSAASEPDALVSHIVHNQIIFLFGVNSTEFWWLSGVGEFPFSRIPNGVVELGCIAKFSPTKYGTKLGWLDHDRIVRQMDGGQGTKISTHWLDEEMRKLNFPQNTHGFTYTTEGHIMFCLTTDKGTFCYDQTTREWHERRSINNYRWRVDGVLKVYNKQIAFDSDSGKFGTIDESIATEWGDPIRMEWTYPPVKSEGRLASHKRLETQLEVGTAAAGDDPQIGLLISDDGGKTWDEMETRSIGQTGEYNEVPVWVGLGSARNRMYRHYISDNVERFIADTQLEVVGGRL